MEDFELKKWDECYSSRLQCYDCCVNLDPPNWSTKSCISVDKCLKAEIEFLWSKGIETTGCCCGYHEQGMGEHSYIGVKPEYIEQMKAMNYQVRYNECRPNDEDSFVPKSLFPFKKYVREYKVVWESR